MIKYALIEVFYVLRLLVNTNKFIKTPNFGCFDIRRVSESNSRCDNFHAKVIHFSKNILEALIIESKLTIII